MTRARGIYCCSLNSVRALADSTNVSTRVTYVDVQVNSRSISEQREIRLRMSQNFGDEFLWNAFNFYLEIGANTLNFINMLNGGYRWSTDSEGATDDRKWPKIRNIQFESILLNFLILLSLRQWCEEINAVCPTYKNSSVISIKAMQTKRRWISIVFTIYDNLYLFPILFVTSTKSSREYFSCHFFHFMVLYMQKCNLEFFYVVSIKETHFSTVTLPLPPINRVR